MSGRYWAEQKTLRKQQDVALRMEQRKAEHQAHIAGLLAFAKEKKAAGTAKLKKICTQMVEQIGTMDIWSDKALELFRMTGDGHHNERFSIVSALLLNGLSPLTLAEFLLEYGSCSHGGGAAADFAGMIYKAKVGNMKLSSGEFASAKIFNQAADTFADGDPSFWMRTQSWDGPKPIFMGSTAEKMLHCLDSAFISVCPYHDLAICLLMGSQWAPPNDRVWYQQQYKSIDASFKRHMTQEMQRYVTYLETLKEEPAQAEKKQKTAGGPSAE